MGISTSYFGGLGTASYGLTKGMSSLEDLNVIFVVPKAWGDEDPTRVRLIGANKIPVAFKQVYYKGFRRPIEKIEISSKIIPYTDPEDFYKRVNSEVSGQNIFIQTNSKGMVDFSGRYDGLLLEEIYKYSVVASVIAAENEFDIIHAHDWLAYPAGIAAMEVSGKPLVIHVHATDFDRSGGNVNPDVYQIEKKGMDAASKIITVSNLTRDIVINKYNIDPDKVETVYNAVDPVRITEDVMVDKGFDEKVVTFLGRITMQKGPEYFIEAAYKVLKMMPNVRFVMAGSGDMMERMMRELQPREYRPVPFYRILRGKDDLKCYNK
jgi:glycosyltransferase involved in cell wall biosynthesis